MAFGKLQGTVTSQLKVSFERDGQREEVPITVVRNYVFAADPQLRERAYHAEQQGWHSIRGTVAACLNAVKGTALTLARRRGWPSVLDWSLDANRIDRPTLDAMLSAIRDAFPMFRRYLHAKARRLGLERLRWWDLFAPLAGQRRRVHLERGPGVHRRTILGLQRRVGQFAQTAFERNWIDAEPRDGKRGGAFCMAVEGVERKPDSGQFRRQLRPGEHAGPRAGTRIPQLLPARAAQPVARRPSTLAETASIFCETLIAEATLAEATARGTGRDPGSPTQRRHAGVPRHQLAVPFRVGRFRRRAQSELSPDEFCELMLDAQRKTYADAIDPATYHRYMWLWKPHYYAYEHNFYNFPYAFGQLFALGLYAIYCREGADFVPRYEALLRATGQDYAAPLAARFGIDITRPEFWQASLDVIGRQVERFEALPRAVPGFPGAVTPFDLDKMSGLSRRLIVPNPW